MFRHLLVLAALTVGGLAHPNPNNIETPSVAAGPFSGAEARSASFALKTRQIKNHGRGNAACTRQLCFGDEYPSYGYYYEYTLHAEAPTCTNTKTLLQQEMTQGNYTLGGWRCAPPIDAKGITTVKFVVTMVMDLDASDSVQDSMRKAYPHLKFPDTCPEAKQRPDTIPGPCNIFARKRSGPPGQRPKVAKAIGDHLPQEHAKKTTKAESTKIITARVPTPTLNFYFSNLDRKNVMAYSILLYGSPHCGGKCDAVEAKLKDKDWPTPFLWKCRDVPRSHGQATEAQFILDTPIEGSPSMESEENTAADVIHALVTDLRQIRGLENLVPVMSRMKGSSMHRMSEWYRNNGGRVVPRGVGGGLD